MEKKSKLDAKRNITHSNDSDSFLCLDENAFDKLMATYNKQHCTSTKVFFSYSKQSVSFIPSLKIRIKCCSCITVVIVCSHQTQTERKNERQMSDTETKVMTVSYSSATFCCNKFIVRAVSFFFLMKISFQANIHNSIQSRPPEITMEADKNAEEKKAEHKKPEGKKAEEKKKSLWYKIMSRHLPKKQRPILPQTYINMQGLSKAQLQPTAPSADEKPIISDTVKARLQSDLKTLLLLNQNTMERRIQPAESCISLPIEKSTLLTIESAAGIAGNAKSNTHNSDLAPSSKSGHDIDDQQELATKMKRPTVKGEKGKISADEPSKEDRNRLPPNVKNDKSDAAKRKFATKAKPLIEIEQSQPSIWPPMMQAYKDKSNIRLSRSSWQPSSKIRKDDTAQPNYTMKSAKKTTHQSNDHNANRLTLVPYSSSDSMRSRARLKPGRKRASKDKVRNWISQTSSHDGSFGLVPNTAYHKKFYIEISQRSAKPKRTRRRSSSSFDDSIFAHSFEQPYKKAVTPTKIYDFGEFTNQTKRPSRANHILDSSSDDDISFEFNTVENDIRAGGGSVAPSISWNSSQLSANRKRWHFDEPRYTEPSSVSSSRFKYRPASHFGQRTVNCHEIESIEKIERLRSGMVRTQRVVKKQMSLPGQSPFMEEIVIQRMKHPQ